MRRASYDVKGNHDDEYTTLHKRLLYSGDPRPPYMEREELSSSSRLGSSEAPSRTSDGKVEGSNPWEGICFPAINDYNFVTSKGIDKLNSLNERARKALQVNVIIKTS